MKSHERHISSQIKLFKPVTTDLSPYRFEVITKNFKKKPHNQDSQVNGSANFLKMEAYRKAQTRSSPNRSESRTKTSRKRSLQRFLINQRGQKVSHSHQGQTNHQSTLSTKSKLLKINGILGHRVNGSSKEMVKQVYQRYEQYLSLVKEWKHLDIFDQLDKLIQNVLDNQMKIMEDLLQETLKNMQGQLMEYQKTILALQDKNHHLSSQLAIYSRFNEVLTPLKEKLMQQYQKSQWGTFILNSLALNAFDVENYIKTIPLYRKWIAPVTSLQSQDKKTDGQESLSNIFETGRQRWLNIFDKKETRELDGTQVEKRRESL